MMHSACPEKKKKSALSSSSGKTQSRLFFTGAALLAVSGIIVKLIGMVYKIPLTNLMGDGGMGYFNSAYTIYTFFLVLSSSGLPSAVSLAVSEARAKGLVNQVKLSYKYSLIIFTSIGAVGTGVMLLLPEQLAAAIGNENAYAAIAAAAPTVVCMCVISALRGYFQGHQYMAPTAFSQISESAGKLIFGMALALYSQNKGNPIHITAAYAVAGLSIGTFVTMLGLVIVKKRTDSSGAFSGGYAEDEESRRPCRGHMRGQREGQRENAGPGESRGGVDVRVSHRCSSGAECTPSDIIYSLLRTSLPVMLGSLVLTLASSSDLFLVMRTLRRLGYTAEQANAAWGNYSAMAVPLFGMPSVLTLPIAMSVCPVVRACISSGNEKGAVGYVKSSFLLTSYIALPCTFGLAVLSGPILSLIFKDEASVASAASLLTLLAMSVLPLAFLSLTNTLLQAYGKVFFPVVSMSVGIALKIGLSGELIERLGMRGVPIGTFICYTAICSLNFAYLARLVGKTGMPGMIIKPFCAAFICALGGYVCYRLYCRGVGESFACLAAIASAVVIYASVIIFTGGIKTDDSVRRMLPGRAADILERLHIIRT